MIKRFHCSLKSALCSRLSSSGWFLHLPLVLLGLRTVPKDDTGLSVSEAVYGSPLTVPGEFLVSPELPPSTYLSKIEQAMAGFAIPLPHHVPQSPPRQLPAALLSAKFVFFPEDASIPSLAPLYLGPYLVLERKDKLFPFRLVPGQMLFLSIASSLCFLMNLSHQLYLNLVDLLLLTFQ